MASFKPLKKPFHLFFIVLLSVCLFQFLNLKPEKNPAFKAVYFLLGSVQSLKGMIHSSLSETTRKYIFILDTYSENKKLKKQISELKTKQSLIEELKAENRKLSQMLHFKQSKNLNLLSARIIDYDLLFKNQMLVINRGSVHGVKKYMGVIHPDGVIGHVFRVSSHSSQVLTLKAKISSLPVLNQRNRIKGLIETNGHKLLLFKYFEEAPDAFKSGDKIVTSLSQHFPPGLPVGELLKKKSTEETPDISSSLFVRPAVFFSAAEEVFVILNTTPKLNEGQNRKTP